METIQIHTSSRDYPVFVGAGAIEELGTFLKEKYINLTKIFIITDSNVGERYLKSLLKVLENFNVIYKIVPNGEHAKTFDVYYDCLTFALEQKLDRKSLLLAFGGGAVGDLGGFVASTFMRGIPFIQIPTTILAHDSAVGGKVAINHPLGKNMIGAFYQPEGVFYDLNFLSSLPEHEIRSGFAEVIKHSLIKDPQFYHWLIKNIDDLTHLNEEQLRYCLIKGIQIKGSIVAEDEKEQGIRAFLNFGHTLGHSIEAEAGYGKITHGEAVMIGMLFALKLSEKICSLHFHYSRFERWIKKLGYKTTIDYSLDNQRLIERMKNDKKTVGQMIQFVLLEKVGSPKLFKIEDEILLKELIDFRQNKR